MVVLCVGQRHTAFKRTHYSNQTRFLRFVRTAPHVDARRLYVIVSALIDYAEFEYCGNARNVSVALENLRDFTASHSELAGPTKSSDVLPPNHREI